MAVKKGNTNTRTAGKARIAAPATMPSRNDMFDAAHLKLGTARAIVDVIAMLDVSGNTDTLSNGSLTTCLIHVDGLLGEARKMLLDSQEAA